MTLASACADLASAVAALQAKYGPASVVTPPPIDPPPNVLGALKNPSAFGWPDATNTGPTGALAKSGTVTTSKAGQLIAGLDIAGQVIIKHPNVTIQNCRITYTGSGRAIDATFDVGDTGTLTIQDTRIICTSGCQCAMFLEHQSVLILRCDISGGQDGIDISTYTGNVTIRDTFIHDLIRASGSHDDCIQPFNAGTILIDHCTLLAYTGGDPMNSCMQIGQLNGPVKSVTLQNSLLNGGNYTINANGSGGGTKVSVLNNRFGTGYQYGVQANLDAPFTTVWSGNVDDATGRTV